MKNKKKLIIGMSAIFVVMIAMIAIIIASNKPPNLLDEVVITKNTETIEHGTEIDEENLVNFENLDENIEVEYLVTSGTLSESDDKPDSATGSTVVLDVTLSHSEKVREERFVFPIVDHEKPILEGIKEFEFTIGDELDFKTHISASDKVDGVLEVVFEGDVDATKAGTYKVVAKATDTNKNEVTAEFDVIIKEKEVASTETTPLPSTGGGTSSGNTTNKPSGSNSGTSGSGNSSSGNNGGNSSNNGGETPKPSEQTTVCPTGLSDKNKPCNEWIDPYKHMAFSHHATMDACKVAGEGIINQFWIIDGKEVVNYACRQLGNNDPKTGTFFRLEIMGGTVVNGIQTEDSWWLNSNKKWVR